MQSQGSEDAKAPPKVTKCNHTTNEHATNRWKYPTRVRGKMHDSYSNQATTSWKYPIRFRGKRQGVQLSRLSYQTSNTPQPLWLPDP
jgi:hypothetical protein